MKRVAIITGSNTGIGKETARGLAEKGYTTVLAVRDVKRGEAARADILALLPDADVEVLRLDQADTSSIRAFAQTFAEKHERLDVLVANAGVWTRTRGATKDGFETTFGVNHLGTFLLVHELLPVLERSAPARVVVVSSGLHYRGKMDWEDLQFERRSYSGTSAYNQSKLANVLFANALARRTADKRITVNSLHPGVVATELTRELPGLLRSLVGLFLLTPAEGARTSLHVALSDEGARVTGAYFDASRQRKAAGAARDEAAQEKLWALSEELLGLRNGTNGTARRAA
jgi:NAD(P)-dependent dehydrogenase (short-subunit alcohol dehydrogenase family)